MAVTRLKRKDRKNKARANNRIERIKHLMIKPVVKHVDMDELRAKYGTGSTETASAEKKSSAKSADSSKEPKAKKEKADTSLGEDIVAEHDKNENRNQDEQNAEPEMTAAGSEDKE
jgi:hypothetical protein